MHRRPLWHWLLLNPARIESNLRRLEEISPPGTVPNVWQVTLGIARMWHRMVFRSDSIGTASSARVRPTVRARFLSRRPLRFPFLLAERAIAPLDFSGLASSPERIIRHLLGAYHDGEQFVYDLSLLAIHPGQLEALRGRAAAVVDGTDARADYLRDLTVFHGYHERLLAAVELAVEGRIPMTPQAALDPDLSLPGYLSWCVAQPATPAATWKALRAGAYTVDAGLRPSRAAQAPMVTPL